MSPARFFGSMAPILELAARRKAVWTGGGWCGAWVVVSLLRKVKRKQWPTVRQVPFC
jgi:hypothetical protein